MQSVKRLDRQTSILPYDYFSQQINNNKQQIIDLRFKD